MNINNFNLQEIIDAATPWLLDSGLKILGILIVAVIAHRFAYAFISRVTRRAVVTDRYQSKEAEEKREDTLIKIFATSANILIWLMTGLMILQEFGIAIGPLLAAAGIVGLAFGFGGQYLIRDLISGLFIIMENQYRIGDVVCFGDTCGVVEDLSLRMTILRDLDGTAHHIPHGTIDEVANLSKDYARVNLNVGVSYNADLEHVIEVINKVGSDMASDPDWKDSIVEAPQFLRVDDFADSSVDIKILGKTKPLQQWDITGELRKRIKIAFDKEGIEIPFPQRVIHQEK